MLGGLLGLAGIVVSGAQESVGKGVVRIGLGYLARDRHRFPLERPGFGLGLGGHRRRLVNLRFG